MNDLLALVFAAAPYVWWVVVGALALVFVVIAFIGLTEAFRSK